MIDFACAHCGRVMHVPEFSTGEPRSCKTCGTAMTHPGYAPKRWNRGVAFILSLLFPGLGQLYRGQLLTGLMWSFVCAIGYVCFIAPGILLHIVCAYCAASGDTTK